MIKEKCSEKQIAVHRQILQLEDLDKHQLASKWRDLFGQVPPHYGMAFMRKRLAYRIQELFYGGLSPAMLKSLLRGDEKTPKECSETEFTTGTVLIRIWKNQRYEVTIRENGYEYNGIMYRSLSQVANKITGSHWNGKKFFKIKENK